MPRARRRGRRGSATGACAASPERPLPPLTLAPACPSSRSVLLQVIAGVGAAVALVYRCARVPRAARVPPSLTPASRVCSGLAVLAHCTGSTLVGGMKRVAELSIWMITTLQAHIRGGAWVKVPAHSHTPAHPHTPQVVSQVARVSSASLPPLMRSLYTAVSVLQLQGIVLPPACTGAYPFELEASLLATTLGLLLTVYVTYGCAGMGGTLRVVLGRGSMTACVVMYPIVASQAMSFLFCEARDLSSTALATLDGGGSVSVPPGAASVSAPLLVSNPFFVCWAGSHRPMAYLSIATLIAYTAGLPLVVFVWLRRDPWLRLRLGLDVDFAGPQIRKQQGPRPRPPPRRRKKPGAGGSSSAGAGAGAGAAAQRTPTRRPAAQSSRRHINIVRRLTATGKRMGVFRAASAFAAYTSKQVFGSALLRIVENPLRAVLHHEEAADVQQGQQQGTDGASSAGQVSASLLALRQQAIISAAIPPDPMLAPFLADYDPAHWFYRQLDLGARARWWRYCGDRCSPSRSCPGALLDAAPDLTLARLAPPPTPAQPSCSASRPWPPSSRAPSRSPSSSPSASSAAPRRSPSRPSSCCSAPFCPRTRGRAGSRPCCSSSPRPAPSSTPRPPT